MTDDRFDEQLRAMARDYHRPPVTPRDEVWRRIVAARDAQRRVSAIRPGLRWAVAIAAVLALGIGIGRWSARRSARPAVVAESRGAGSDQAPLAYRVAAAQYLTRTEALLTGFRSEARAGRPDALLATRARDLLATTRLMLDSPAGRDPRLKSLLEDLELVLAQIAQLPSRGANQEVQLINEGLDQRSVLLRLRSANPAGSSPVRAQGAL